MELEIPMVLPFECGEYPCEAAAFRGSLKHSHLENTYLNTKYEPCVLREILNEVIHEKAFYEMTRELYDGLVSRLAHDYDPLSIAAEFPFLATIPGLQDRYYAEFRPQDRIKRLGDIGKTFFPAIAIFCKCDMHDLTSHCAAMRVEGQRLYEELLTLPKGVWLP